MPATDPTTFPVTVSLAYIIDMQLTSPAELTLPNKESHGIVVMIELWTVEIDHVDLIASLRMKKRVDIYRHNKQINRPIET